METAKDKKGAEARSTIAATVGAVGGKQENSETASNSCSPEQSQEKHPMVSGKNYRRSGARSQSVTLPAGSDSVQNRCPDHQSDRLHQCDRSPGVMWSGKSCQDSPQIFLVVIGEDHPLPRGEGMGKS
ncbi:MAG: hypothetical protein RIG27_28295 [Coleofasciculus sp. F4-SAH-05]